MLPAYRVRDSRGVSESDWSNTHARVFLPRSDGGYVKAWVKIVSGDHLRGTGIVDDKVDSRITLGTPIVYDGGTESGVTPKFVRKQHRANKTADLLKGVAEQLVKGMQFKVTEPVKLPARRRRMYVARRVIEQHS